MTKGLRYVQQIIISRQGPWNLVWIKQVYELSEVELTEFHCRSKLWKSNYVCNLPGSSTTTVKAGNEKERKKVMVSIRVREDNFNYLPDKPRRGGSGSLLLAVTDCTATSSLSISIHWYSVQSVIHGITVYTYNGVIVCMFVFYKRTFFL